MSGKKLTSQQVLLGCKAVAGAMLPGQEGVGEEPLPSPSSSLAVSPQHPVFAESNPLGEGKCGLHSESPSMTEYRYRRMGLKMKNIILFRKLNVRKKKGYKSMIKVLLSK